MALQAYRGLMRAVQLAFKDDMPILIAAREQVRAGFLEKRGLNPSDNDTTVAIRHAEDVAKILRENVVQGKQAEGKENTYNLRIHEHTERGDNDSVKTAGKGGATNGGCGCN